MVDLWMDKPVPGTNLSSYSWEADGQSGFRGVLVGDELSRRQGAMEEGDVPAPSLCSGRSGFTIRMSRLLFSPLQLVSLEIEPTGLNPRTTVSFPGLLPPAISSSTAPT